MNVSIFALAAYLMGAMRLWIPPTEHAYKDRERVVTDARYYALATTIAEVVLDEEETLPPGLDEVEAGLLLASVAAAESAYRADVMTCKVSGKGVAWGPYQYQGNKAKVCGSLDQATRWALHMLTESWVVCMEHAVDDRAAFYVNGICKPNWQRSRARVGRALKFAETRPFDPDDREGVLCGDACANGTLSL